MSHPESQATEQPSTALIAVGDLRLCEDGDVRIEDIVLGKALGFSRAADIRRVIKANADEIESCGGFSQSCEKSSGGRPSQSYLLNQAQAVLVSMFSKTKRSRDVRREIVEVFLAYRRRSVRPMASQSAPSLTRAQQRHQHEVRDLKFRFARIALALSDLGVPVEEIDLRKVVAFGQLLSAR